MDQQRTTPAAMQAAMRYVLTARRGAFANYLVRIGACAEAVEWVGARTRAQALRDCERADWMLWLLFTEAGQPGRPTIQTAYLCTCDCAETALRYVPAGEDRPRLAIEARRRWCAGEATDAEVDAAGAAASDAAEAAARAAAVAAAKSADWDAASDAAWAAARAATTAAAGNAAWSAAHKRMANLIRARLASAQ